MNGSSVVDARTNIAAMRFKISADTPDINCIKKIFYAMRKKINEDVVEQGILKRHFWSFKNDPERFVFTISIEPLAVCENGLT